MNPVWSCSPLPPPCDLTSRSNPITSAARSRLHLRRVISPLDRTQSPLSLPSSLNVIEFDDFFFFFWFCFFCISLFRNNIIYLFGSWENVRKCEQQGENMFSIVFSRTQPNTKKYFSKYFLKCHQSLENIFFSEKYFNLKIFYTWKIFYIELNTV